MCFLMNSLAEGGLYDGQVIEEEEVVVFWYLLVCAIDQTCNCQSRFCNCICIPSFEGAAAANWRCCYRIYTVPCMILTNV
jgi:hypothetical protein